MPIDTRLEVLFDVLITRLADEVVNRLAVSQQQAQSPQMPDGLLDEPAMAERLHISQQSLQRRRKAGVVPCVRCGRRVLYRPDDVIAALQSQSHTGGTP